MKWGLNVGIIITLVGMFIGGMSSHVRMIAKAEDTAAKVVAVEKRIEELEAGTKWRGWGVSLLIVIWSYFYITTQKKK